MANVQKNMKNPKNSVSGKKNKPIKIGYTNQNRILHQGISNGWETPKEMFSILTHREMQIKSTLRFHLTPLKMTVIKETEHRCCRGIRKKQGLKPAGDDAKSVTALWKSGWDFLNIELPCHLVILLLILHPEESSLLVRDTCIPMVTAVLSTAAKPWCQQRHLKNWMTKENVHIYVKAKNSQTKKYRCSSFSLICEI